MYRRRHQRDDVPADWQCPACGVARADFEMRSNNVL
ncbi:rubredoxin [Collimonas sp. NPDC087041]